jgi:hypothetical protein
MLCETREDSRACRRVVAFEGNLDVYSVHVTSDGPVYYVVLFFPRSHQAAERARTWVLGTVGIYGW